MPIIKPSLLALCLASLAGGALAEEAKSEDAGTLLKEETRVYLGSCLLSNPPPPPQPAKATHGEKFLATLGPLLAVAAKQAVVDFAVGALKAAGEDKSTQAIAAYPANGWMYQLDTAGRLVIHPRSRCVTIVSGSFWNGLRMEPPDTAASTPVRDEGSHVPLDDSSVLKPESAKIAADGDARVLRWKQDHSVFFGQLRNRYRQLRWTRFFFEARLEPMEGTDDKFTLAPSALYFEKPVDGSFFDIFRGAKRNVLVTISLGKAGAEDGKTFASVNFPFRDVPSNTLLTPLYFKGHTSRAIQVPELTEDEKTGVLAKKAQLGLAAREVTLAWGPAPTQPTFVPPDSFEDSNYLAAAERYCAALDAYNKAIEASKNAIPLTAPECPVPVQLAKLKLTKARKTFDDDLAKRKAAFDTQHVWLLDPKHADNQGVSCVVKNPKAASFEHGCALTSPSDLRPITASASVVEVREGSKFAAFLGKVLEKAQPGINAAIEADTPDKKAEKQEQSKKDVEAYQLAVAGVAVAQAKLTAVLADADASEADKASARLELLTKQQAANQAARKAGLTEPYPGA